MLREDLVALAVLTVLAETVLRVSPAPFDLMTVLKVCGVVVLELVAQYSATMGFALVDLWWRGWYPRVVVAQTDKARRDGRQENFQWAISPHNQETPLTIVAWLRPSLIPLTLLYTSLLPLLLQLFLSIWYTPATNLHEQLPSPSSFSPISTLPQSLLSLLPQDSLGALLEFESAIAHTWATADKVWVGTRLLGGMSAGFGLRVLLPTRPWETTVIILAGWVAAASVARLMT